MTKGSVIFLNVPSVPVLSDPSEFRFYISNLYFYCQVNILPFNFYWRLTNKGQKTIDFKPLRKEFYV